MDIQVHMPKLGQIMESGEISKWFYQEGESIKKGEPLVEIITDKVTTEIEAPETGTLEKILFAASERADVGAVIAIVATRQEQSIVPQPVKPEKEETPVKEPGGMALLPEWESTTASFSQPSPVAVAAPAPRAHDDQRTSPVARRLAKEHGIDIARVPPSRPGTRITKEDVLAYIATLGEQNGAQPIAATQAMLAVEIDFTDLMGFALGYELATGKPLAYVDLLAKIVAASLSENPQLNPTGNGKASDAVSISVDDGLDIVAPTLASQQTAALSVGRIIPRAAVVNGSVAVRSLGWAALTYDQKVIDRHSASCFLRRVAEMVTNPKEFVRVSKQEV